MESFTGEVDLALDNAQELERRIDAWHQAGDVERLQLVQMYEDVLQHRESDPEYQFTVLTQARDEARRLNEPWWILYFDYWRLSTLTADMHDFTRALPLAMELMVRVARPENVQHPYAFTIQMDVLYTYVQVDPFGHREELERGFAYLDKQISREPPSDRFVFNFRWIEYLQQTQRWREAFNFAREHQSLVDRGGSRAWPLCWCLFLLCNICDALGLADELMEYAEEMVERSTGDSRLKRTLASGWIWRAVIHRTRGEERTASRAFHTGMRHLQNLSSAAEICADALVGYYTLGGDTKAALSIRDRELVAIAKKGMNHRSAVLHLERCKLLNQMGKLTSSDLDDARNAAAKLLHPEEYLQMLSDLG
jgi:hypothetical protein